MSILIVYPFHSTIEFQKTHVFLQSFMLSLYIYKESKT